MSSGDPRVTAHLTGRVFHIGELMGLKLTVYGPGLMPDPFSGSDALTLRLRGPSGKTEVVHGRDIPQPVIEFDLSESVRIPPGEKEVFETDIATHFPNMGPGHHVLQVEYKVNGTWRSPELPFEVLTGGGTFLDVTPNDASGFGLSGVVWVERGAKGSRVLLFEDDRAKALQGAEEIAAALPDGVEPALASMPLNKPFPERWVAWISGHALHAQYFSDGDPKRDLHAPVVKLPADLHEPRIVRPLLDEWASPARPRCTIPVLATNGGGTQVLQLFDLDAKGRVTPGQAVPIPGRAAGCWAIGPTTETRLFAYALADAGQAYVLGFEVPWRGHGHVPAADRWFGVEADAFLLGDLRCSMHGLVWVGAVVRRGGAWERVVFVPPGGARKEAQLVYRSSFKPPDGAEPVRARVDGSGRLHVLYRRGKQLAYVPPDAQEATFTSDRLGARAAATAHMVLGLDNRRVIVAYDPDHGPVWKVL